MSNINNLNWTELDKENEEVYIDGIRFIRPTGVKSLPLDCPCCKELICTVEDVESIKENDVCENCYLEHYYKNKEKWQKGWRPFNN